MKRSVFLLLAIGVAAIVGTFYIMADPGQPANEPTAAVDTETAGAAADTTAAAEDSAPDTGRIELAQAETDLAAVEALGYVSGRHYQRLSPTQLTSTTPGQVEVIEFFMHSCIHCANLEPYVEEWLETKPDYINFVRVPTTWGAERTIHAQAYYTAEALDKVDEMQLAFFREYHNNGNRLDTPAKLAEFFSRYGVSEEEFESTFDSFSVNVNLRRATELGDRYRIDSTPTFIINGKYRTGVGEAGGTPEQLWELIEALAAAERGQG